MQFKAHEEVKMIASRKTKYSNDSQKFGSSDQYAYLTTNFPLPDTGIKKSINNSSMKRRAAIRGLMIIAGGIALLPSCSGDPAKASIELTNLDITSGQEALLADIAETLIPKTADAPGAKDLNLHLFAMKMVDDCHSHEDQEQFMSGLKNFESAAREKAGAPFNKLDDTKKLETLSAMLKDEKSPDLQSFLKITKRRVIQGFTNSEFVMTGRKQYEMVPGRYNGFFPVQS